jgi:aminoglycoside phosphotransferase (APT) family kinase protein
MKDSQGFQKRLVAYIESNYNSGSPLGGIELPPQGMSSSVFFIKFSNDRERAVKYGANAIKDVPALELIAKKQINIPIPALIASFVFEGVPVIILERINFLLLESVPVEEMPKYVPSMVRNLKELHKIKSESPGLLVGKKKDGETWKGIMLSIFDGGDIDWNEVSKRESLDGKLILASVDKMKTKIEKTVFDLKEYSLLHTDFNQRNLFVDPEHYEIAGIIDWEDAMFGDPIYDFARVRMYLWHFNFKEAAIHNYYDLVNFSAEQKKLEDLYWLSRVIQYLAWYSEELTEFNVSRIKLHQEYLRSYSWE